MFRTVVFPILLAACVKQLPAAQTPPPVMPPVAVPPPPAPGQGRLIVDVVDGPTPVERVVMEPTPATSPTGRTTFELSERAQPLCPRTPCVADVPLGNVLVGFPVIGDPAAREVELVHVGPDPSVYRRALSVYVNKSGATRVLGIIATALGGASAITGTALLPIGLSKENDAMTTAGGITLGGGLVVMVLGILAIRADSPTFQPGAANHFPAQGLGAR